MNTLQVDQTKSAMHQLPATGLVRASELLKYMPFARSTLWSWSKSGQFIKPIKIGSITVWRCELVWQWINEQGKQEQEAGSKEIAG